MKIEKLLILIRNTSCVVKINEQILRINAQNVYCIQQNSISLVKSIEFTLCRCYQKSFSAIFRRYSGQLSNFLIVFLFCQWFIDSFIFVKFIFTITFRGSHEHSHLVKWKLLVSIQFSHFRSQFTVSQITSPKNRQWTSLNSVFFVNFRACFHNLTKMCEFTPN